MRRRRFARRGVAGRRRSFRVGRGRRGMPRRRRSPRVRIGFRM